MPELAEQLVRFVDDVVAPVTAEEARSRAHRSHRRRRNRALAFGVIAAIGVTTLAVSRAADDGSEVAVTETTATMSPTPMADPAIGDAIGVIEIPSIGVRKVVVQGTGADELKMGPGHDPLSVMPGARGFAVIAGRRTTYGAPFNQIDELRPGDEIDITLTNAQPIRYNVVASSIDTFAFEADDGSYASDEWLLLVTNNPEYSDAGVLYVLARRVLESP